MFQKASRHTSTFSLSYNHQRSLATKVLYSSTFSAITKELNNSELNGSNKIKLKMKVFLKWKHVMESFLAYSWSKFIFRNKKEKHERKSVSFSPTKRLFSLGWDNWHAAAHFLYALLTRDWNLSTPVRWGIATSLSE